MLSYLHFTGQKKLQFIFSRIQQTYCFRFTTLEIELKRSKIHLPVVQLILLIYEHILGDHLSIHTFQNNHENNEKWLNRIYKEDNSTITVTTTHHILIIDNGSVSILLFTILADQVTCSSNRWALRKWPSKWKGICLKQYKWYHLC